MIMHVKMAAAHAILWRTRRNYVAPSYCRYKVDIVGLQSHFVITDSITQVHRSVCFALSGHELRGKR